MSITRPDPLDWQEGNMDIPNRPLFKPANLPPIGSTWRKPAWGDRTVIAHRFNEWSGCWHVTVSHEHGGPIEIPLSKWKRWASGAERIDICSECGKNPADLPSRLCAGCEAYREHTAHA